MHFVVGAWRTPFQKRTVARAVDGVSLRVDRNEAVALIGESGCGKTTTALSILQLQKPSAGSVRFDGIELTRLPGRRLRRLRRRMQMVFQDPYSSLNPRMTVQNILTAPLEIHKVGSGKAKDDRARELLQLVGLSVASLHRYPHEFSGGQRQRVAIARALALNPDFLVADEPVSSLDASVRAQIVVLLQDLRRTLGYALLLISHDLSVVRRLSDRVAVMYLGKIVEECARGDLFQRPLHPYTQALLSAEPVASLSAQRGRPRIILAGEAPSVLHPPSGCRFRTRCWKAQQVCSEIEPELAEHETGHWAACHFAETNGSYRDAAAGPP